MTESQIKKILVFKLAEEELGLDISCVYEVLNLGKIHSFVQVPDFVRGVIDLRGHIIAVVDLRKKFGIKPESVSDDSKIIVCKIKRFVAGLLVDGTREVIEVFNESIASVPGVISTQSINNCVAGIIKLNDRIISLIDLEKIFTEEEEKSFTEIKK